MGGRGRRGGGAFAPLAGVGYQNTTGHFTCRAPSHCEAGLEGAPLLSPASSSTSQRGTPSPAVTPLGSANTFFSAGENEDKDGGNHVLVVDDDPSIRKFLTKMLQKNGFRVRAEQNGFEGLSAMRAQQFKIVFMDRNMPVMDGLECIKRFRDWENLHYKKDRSFRQYIAMVSANSYESDIQEGLTSGADDFLSKPVKMARLLEAVAAAAQAREKEGGEGEGGRCGGGGGSLRTDALVLLRSTSAESITNTAKHSPTAQVLPWQQQGEAECRPVLLVDDDVSILKFTRMMLTKQGYLVETAPNGLLALEKLCRLSPSTGKSFYQAAIVDVEMPVMGGLECVSRLREWESEQMDYLRSEKSSKTSTHEKKYDFGTSDKESNLQMPTIEETLSWSCHMRLGVILLSGHAPETLQNVDADHVEGKPVSISRLAELLKDLSARVVQEEEYNKEEVQPAKNLDGTIRIKDVRTPGGTSEPPANPTSGATTVNNTAAPRRFGVGAAIHMLEAGRGYIERLSSSSHGGETSFDGSHGSKDKGEGCTGGSGGSSNPPLRRGGWRWKQHQRQHQKNSSMSRNEERVGRESESIGRSSNSPVTDSETMDNSSHQGGKRRLGWRRKSSKAVTITESQQQQQFIGEEGTNKERNNGPEEQGGFLVLEKPPETTPLATTENVLPDGVSSPFDEADSKAIKQDGYMDHEVTSFSTAASSDDEENNDDERKETNREGGWHSTFAGADSTSLLSPLTID